MNGHELDERTDEFALAAVTYEILTGKRHLPRAASMRAPSSSRSSISHPPPRCARTSIPALTACCSRHFRPIPMIGTTAWRSFSPPSCPIWAIPRAAAAACGKSSRWTTRSWRRKATPLPNEASSITSRRVSTLSSVASSPPRSAGGSALRPYSTSRCSIPTSPCSSRCFRQSPR